LPALPTEAEDADAGESRETASAAAGECQTPAACHGAGGRAEKIQAVMRIYRIGRITVMCCIN